MRSFSFMVSSVLLLACACAAQQNAAIPSSVPTVRLQIRKIAAAVHVDGKLEEGVWREVEPITSFTQRQPDEGAPVSERTEARIFYDDSNIYFGFKFYDDPEKIRGRMAGHDTPTGSDSADILIDTFNDHRTGFWFSISAGGVQFDGTVNDRDTGDFRINPAMRYVGRRT